MGNYGTHQSKENIEDVAKMLLAALSSSSCTTTPTVALSVEYGDRESLDFLTSHWLVMHLLHLQPGQNHTSPNSLISVCRLFISDDAAYESETLFRIG